MQLNDDHYKLYLNDTFKLAKTLSIKSNDSRDGINDWIQLVYGKGAVNLDDPTTWKYYLNLSGQPHFSDKSMRVTSLDTLEEIEFTKANLNIHTTTREAYQYGTRYYQTLLSVYPDQEPLILGILYPVDIQTAIAAEEGTILAYPKSLVEAQEITLLTELELWIKRYLIRWHVRSFGATDSLYPAAAHAVMYLQLVPKLLNLRVKRCKTAEAHRFHIRSYLASHGRLDRYLDYMTTEQALFLYRNIAYIERHAGHTDTFEWLIDKLLSARFIPIAEYSARQTGQFDEQYYPDYQLRKKPLNPQYNVPEKDYFSLAEVLLKERQTALWNKSFIPTELPRIETQFKNSLSSVIQTKDLESSMVDYTDVVPYRLNDILLNHWAYLSSVGMYKIVINFKDPRTGDIRALYSNEAFIYLMYLTLKSINIDIEKIPTFLVSRIQRMPRPTVDDLMSVADHSDPQSRVVAEWLVSNQPVLKAFYSKTSFFNFSQGVFDASMAQWYLTSRTEHMTRRGLYANMVNQLYGDAILHFPETGQDYQTWLAEKGLPVDYSYTYNETVELIDQLFQQSTGLIIEPTKLIKNIQAAMLAMMSQLSSYSIQFIRSINESGIRPLNWPAIRLGDSASLTEAYKYIEMNLRVIESHTISAASVSSTDTLVPISRIIGNRQWSEVVCHSGLAMQYVQPIRQSFNCEIPAISIDLNLDSIELTSGFIGYASYQTLTAAQQASLVDIYHS